MNHPYPSRSTGPVPSIQTYTGKEVFPLSPDASAIDIRDIAHSLALQVRFAGHTAEPYSIAQHSVLVSYMVPKQYALWGLLHDASEAYLVDLPRPIKHHPAMAAYRDAEAVLMKAVCDHFCLEYPEPPSVKAADRVILYLEIQQLFRQLPEWVHIPSEILAISMPIPWPYRVAEKTFMDRYVELVDGPELQIETACRELLGIAPFAEYGNKIARPAEN